ncbi:MAG: hypothetical protein HQL50_15920 [Magnetococcales bacterium]|nr:hypothetical protein [Magnetococcales bacterium]
MQAIQAQSVVPTNPAIAHALKQAKPEVASKAAPQAAPEAVKATPAPRTEASAPAPRTEASAPAPRAASRFGQATQVSFSTPDVARAAEELKTPDTVVHAIKNKVQDFFKDYPNGGMKPEFEPRAEAQSGSGKEGGFSVSVYA